MPSQNSPLLRLRSAPLFRISGVSICLLLAGSLFGKAVKKLTGNDVLNRLLNVDQEANLPSYFSSLQLLLAGLLLLALGAQARSERRPFAPQWTLLGAGFVFLSFDENCQIHEMFGEIPLKPWLGGLGASWLNFHWVLFAIPAVVGVALYFWKFLWHLPPETRLHFVLSAFGYVGAAVGLEMVGGKIVAQLGSNTLAYIAECHTEEGLEMISIAFFIRAILRYHEAEGRLFCLASTDEEVVKRPQA